MRVIAIILVVLSLSGCANHSSGMERALSLRHEMLDGNGCEFTCDITADYGQTIHKFTLNCRTDTAGLLKFEVLKPESIAGITGYVEKESGALTFDDQALMFESLTDGQLSPLSAPWIFVNTIRSGYINACGKDGDTFCMQIDDSYAADALRTEIWTNSENTPIRGEIIWQGRRILSLDVKNFIIL